MSPLAKSMHQKSLNDQISHHENNPTDLRLKRLSDKILPDSPYIITVPTTYRVSSHQVNDWRRGSPFGADEEQLQYLSFNSHTWDDTMLNAVGDWDDGHGGIADKSSQNSSKTNSGLGSPLPGQPPRKKISLQAYKNKTAAQAGAKLSPGANGEKKVQEQVKAPAVAPVKDVIPVKEAQPQGQKRYLSTFRIPWHSLTDSEADLSRLPNKTRHPRLQITMQLRHRLKRLVRLQNPPARSPRCRQSSPRAHASSHLYCHLHYLPVSKRSLQSERRLRP